MFSSFYLWEKSFSLRLEPLSSVSYLFSVLQDVLYYVTIYACCDRYIFLEDLMHFMSRDEPTRTTHLFGTAAEKEGISKSAQKDWVVK